MLTTDRSAKHDEWIYALEAAAPGPTAAFALARPLLRGWLTLCDALVVGLARSPARTAADHLRVLLSPQSRHFRRPAAALNLLDKLLPGVARCWGSLALRDTHFPVRGATLSVLDHGTGDTVYALETGRGRMVCKVQRASLGRPLAELIALASHRRRGYEAVLRTYRGMEEVFPGTHFLVVQGPLFGVPAVLSLQEYVGGRKLDLLHDVDDESLVRLLCAYPKLREQVRGFLGRTLQAWEVGEWIVDLGKGNLLVVEERGSLRLVYLDVQMKQVGRLRTRRHQGTYQPQIERMRHVLSLAATATT